jgi:hypothetical protein
VTSTVRQETEEIEVAKEKKTASELAEMMASELPSDIRFNVHKDTVGWHAVLYGSSPDHVRRAQVQVDQVVERLRSNYELGD